MHIMYNIFKCIDYWKYILLFTNLLFTIEPENREQMNCHLFYYRWCSSGLEFDRYPNALDAPGGSKLTFIHRIINGFMDSLIQIRYQNSISIENDEKFSNIETCLSYFSKSKDLLLQMHVMNCKHLTPI